MELADVIQAMRDANEWMGRPLDEQSNAANIKQHIVVRYALQEAMEALMQAQREIAHHNNMREVLDV